MKCCNLTTMCGCSLQYGVVIVGTATTLISSITLAYAMSVIELDPDDKGLNGRPVEAVSFIFGLFSISISMYQIGISLLLTGQAALTKGDIFLCTLWYVSHISILSFCCLLIIATTTICFIAEQYFKAVATAIAGLLYNGVFIYFLVIVNNFSDTINGGIYY